VTTVGFFKYCHALITPRKPPVITRTRMFYLCKGHSKKRLVLSCTRFYSQEELYRMTRELPKSIPTWLEYGPNMYQRINNDCELRFACSMVQGDIESNLPVEDYEQHKLDQQDYIHTNECENSFRPRRLRALRLKAPAHHKRDIDTLHGTVVHRHRRAREDTTHTPVSCDEAADHISE
jgi:hypothetical protein